MTDDATATDTLPVCVYVNSYNPGYSWSDGIERGLRQTLEGRCTIVQENMDTKTHFSEKDKRAAGLRAFELIAAIDPALVITSDDNAAKYLVVPYLMNTELPVVFSGINWTVEEYGFPVPNVTGIVEVAPVLPLLKAGQSLSAGGHRAIFLAANEESQRKNLLRYRRVARPLGITVSAVLSKDFAGWRKSLQQAQDYDFIIVSSMQGIRGWDTERARQIALDVTQRPTLTNVEWIMPIAHLGFTKITEEHGEWAGAAATAILDGVKPADIPLATNRKWDVWINPALIERNQLEVDQQVLKRAKVLP